MINTSKIEVLGDARTLAVDIYRLTATFPSSERFGLTAQMRRAAVSVGSNIAEGCGRYGDRSLAAFLDIARGSVNELAFQLELSTDLGFVRAEDVSAPRLQLDALARRLNRFATTVRTRAAKSADRR